MSYNKGTKYLFAGNYKKALQFFKKEELQFKELYLNMGNCYRYFGEFDAAERCYLLANRSDMPASNNVKTEMYPLALNNLGLLEYARGNDTLAIDYYRAALAIDPVYYDALWNLGNATLRRYFSSEVGLAEDWKLGWELYDYRFKRSGVAVKIDVGLPTWDGRTPGKSIVVLTEQGLGDKIMFGRYISCLYKYFDEVHVQCHPSLDCFYSDFKICRDIFESGASVSVPLCSLAGHFGMVSENWLSDKFTAHDFGEGFHIGVVWAGSATHANTRNRNCPPGYFLDLGSYGKLWNLNVTGECPGISNLNSKSWSETASYVLGLDLVVTVDTSIVHLCGTLGVPCIMMQPLSETDFRWGLGHTDTPWYKSVIIVDNPGSWDATFVTVKEILKCIKK